MASGRIISVWTMNSFRELIMKTFFRGALKLGALCGWALLLMPPAVVWSAPSDSLTVRITPKDVYPPAAVTDLNATVGGIGQMLLEWSAPDSDNNLFAARSPSASYIIRIATFSADSVGSTTTWWNNAQDVTGEPVPSYPGVLDSILLNGLATNTSYYAAIISIDSVGNASPIDVLTNTPNQQAFAYLPASLSPPTPNNFIGTALSSTTIRWSWSLAPGATMYNLYEYPSGVLLLQSTTTFVDETGFTANTAARRALRAENTYGISSLTPDRTVYTLANAPFGLVITTISFDRVGLLWDGSNNPTGTNYQLERAPDGVVFGSILVSTNVTHTDTGLTELTSYYYRVRARNGDNILTAPSTIVSTFTLRQEDRLTPASPQGLKGSIDSTGQAFTLIWESVTKNSDGSDCTDLVGYHIYRRDSLTGPATRLTPTPISITAFADLTNNQVRYYTIRAVDTSNNLSEESLLADSSPDANIIFLGADGQSQLIMPESVNDLLRSGFNKYGVTLKILMNEEPVASDNQIIRHIRLSLVRTDNNQVLSDLSFAQPQSIIAVGYNSVNGLVVPGAPVVGQTPDVSAAATTPDKLSIYWNNGVTWVKVGGVLDLFSQTVKTRSSFLGSFQLRASAAATSLSLSQGNVFPRLFTPNNDGFNDRVYFVLENPNNVAVRGEILDLAGRHVANLAPQSGTGIGTTLIWDGKDDTGSVVPSGAYMYKLQGEGKTFTGTVAVAR